MQDKIELLCQGFKRSQSKDSPISVAGAFAAFTADVISHYSFGFSYNQLESEDFEGNMQAIYVAMNQMGHVIVQMPWINTLIMSLPDSVVEKMNPDFGKMLQNKRVSLGIVSCEVAVVAPLMVPESTRNRHED